MHDWTWNAWMTDVMIMTYLYTKHGTVYPLYFAIAYTARSCSYAREAGGESDMLNVVCCGSVCGKGSRRGRAVKVRSDRPS